MTAVAGVNTQLTKPTARRRRDYLPYLLALPIIIYEGVFILIPILQQFFSSFTSDVLGMGPVRWVGLDNYERMFADRYFWNSLRVTLVFMVGTVIVSVGAGLLSALLLNQRFRGRSVARAVMTLPWAFPDLPTVLIFYWILNQNFGVINVFARFLLPWLEQNPKWMFDINLAMPLVVFIAAWKAFPFYGLVLLSVMQSIPHELYEAATVDGASRRQAFRYVTLPELIPTLMLMGILACIFAFRQFVLIFLSTGGGPARATETLVISVYKTAFNSFDFSYGATIGVAGFAVVFAITLAFAFLQRRQEAAAGG
ncbi:MAG: sugar ABC transporter permease [Anaerolineae bacterium]|nr:sugar ABC transporter permease [Anaerolineae bacterium]MBN8618215.1 sugar ABC transporter permease [Anaerolineae bacterium]